MIVIANSTIFIGLAKIGKLYLLQKIFSKVYIPKEVHKELTLKGQNKPGSHIIRKSKRSNVPTFKHSNVQMYKHILIWQNSIMFI